MSREWKPGDVALNELTGESAIRHEGSLPDERWVWAGVSRDGHMFRASADFGPMRPLVVIDPEDREQVERFNRIYFAHLGEREPNVREQDDALQAALRSLIAPPKPPEPQGLGAVVEDVGGRRWVRWIEGPTKARAWVPEQEAGPHVSAGSGAAARWDDIEVTP